MLKMEYVIYADFETLTIPPYYADSELTERSEYQNHTPCGYGIVAVDRSSRSARDKRRAPVCFILRSRFHKNAFCPFG
jgi:hypothetical protein